MSCWALPQCGTGELQASVGCWLKALWVREAVLSNSLHGTESLERGENCPGSLGISPSSPSDSSAATATADSSVLWWQGLEPGVDGADSLRNHTCSSVLVTGLADTEDVGVEQLQHWWSTSCPHVEMSSWLSSGHPNLQRVCRVMSLVGRFFPSCIILLIY